MGRHGRRRVPGLVCLVVAACACGALAAGSGTARAARPCAHGKVRYRRRCVKATPLSSVEPGRNPLYDLLTAAARMPLRPVGHQTEHVRPALLARLLRRLRHIDSVMTTLEAHARGQASAAAVRAADVTETRTEPFAEDGWKGTQTESETIHDGQDGSDVTASVDASSGASKLQLKIAHKWLVASCPDSGGVVPGVGEDAQSQRTEIPGPNGTRLVDNTSWDAKFTLAGHTSDAGTLHDWDQHMSFLFHVQYAVLDSRGKVIETTAPAVWTVKADANLTPGSDALAALGESNQSFSGLGVHHLFGHDVVFTFTDDGRAAGKASALAHSRWAFGADSALETFNRAAHDHWDVGGCVKIALTAPKTTLAPGEQVPVTVQLSSPTGGVAPAAVTATTNSGDVAPAGATGVGANPLTLTFTAPSPFDAGDTSSLRVDSVSKQGKGSALLDFRPLPQAGYELRYTHASSGEDSYSYNLDSPPYLVDHGTFSESRDVQVSATVPLQQSADGSYSGSGPIRWDRQGWSFENDNIGTNQAGGTCEVDDHEAVTSASGGTLGVSSLKLGGAPSASVTLDGLDETWHQHDVPIAGPCPGLDKDYDRQILLAAIAYVHGRGGDHVDTQYDDHGHITSVGIKLDSGWQPGAGEVAATRTLSGTVYGLGPDDPADMQFTDTFSVVRTGT